MLYTVIYCVIYYTLYIKIRLAIGKLSELDYSNKLYFKWLSDHLNNVFNVFDIIAGILTIISFYVTFKVKVVLLVISILLIIYGTENIKYRLMINKEDININKNNRFFRLITLFVFIYIIPFILGLIFYKHRVLYLNIGIILLIFSYLILLLNNIILLPLESIINKIVSSSVLRRINKLDIHFIGLVGVYGKGNLSNILKQLIDKNTYVIKDLLDLYNIKIKNNSYIIFKLDYVNNNIKKIIFNDLLCTKEINNEDLFIINNIKYDRLYFYKQSKLIDNINNNNIYYYGDSDALINLVDYKISIDDIKFTYKYKDKIYKDSTKTLGIYNLYHIMVSILLLDNLNISYKNKIKDLVNLEHNLTIKKLNGFTMIDDRYHSNLNSFREGLNILNTIKGIKILVTPGLKYCDYLLAKDIVSKVDYIILLGDDNSKWLYDALIKNGFNDKHIFITNDTYESYEMISNLDIKGDIYALYENELSSLYKD